MGISMTSAAAAHVAKFLANRGKGLGIRQGLAQFHLLHEEPGVLGYRLRARVWVQAEQVQGPLQGVLEDLKPLVDPGRCLHGQAPLLVGGAGEAVRVDGVLERPEALGQQLPVQGKAHREAEQLKVIAGEVQHGGTGAQSRRSGA